MRLLHGDCLNVLRDVADATIDSVVTDPPYGISFMGQHWDRFDSEARVGKHDVSQLGVRLTGGADSPNRKLTSRTASAFANPAGEAGGYDLSADGHRTFQGWCEAWSGECLRVLKPGGHLVSFGGTRTYHRLAAGIEDAGFEIRDQLAWLFGQGFPKSLNLEGAHEGWGTALKPGYEPIVLARKPCRGSVAANAAAHGVGALNIDGCRIPIVDVDQYQRNHAGDRGHAGTRDKEERGATDLRPGGGSAAGARWPANVLLDEAAAELLDEQTGVLRSGGYPPAGGQRSRGPVYEGAPNERGAANFGSTSGGASRFFYCAKVSAAERHAGLTPSLLTPTDAPEENDHPTVKPLALMRWLIRLITPPGGIVLDPFLGSGTTAAAAALEGHDFVGIEREEAYLRIARARVAYWSGQPLEEIA